MCIRDRDIVDRCADIAHQYLTKPCNVESLQAAIHRATLAKNEALKKLISPFEHLPTELPVLASGEPTEFSRYCWIAAMQDLAAESALVPAPNNAPVSHGASPREEALADVSPAGQLK